MILRTVICKKTKVGVSHFIQIWEREIFGEQLISVFGNGTCGDLNHVDVSRSPDATKRVVITKK
jgi:hypothetical protein